MPIPRRERGRSLAELFALPPLIGTAAWLPDGSLAVEGSTAYSSSIVLYDGGGKLVLYDRGFQHGPALSYSLIRSAGETTAAYDISLAAKVLVEFNMAGKTHSFLADVDGKLHTSAMGDFEHFADFSGSGTGSFEPTPFLPYAVDHFDMELSLYASGRLSGLLASPATPELSFGNAMQLSNVVTEVAFEHKYLSPAAARWARATISATISMNPGAGAPFVATGRGSSTETAFAMAIEHEGGWCPLGEGAGCDPDSWLAFLITPKMTGSFIVEQSTSLATAGSVIFEFEVSSFLPQPLEMITGFLTLRGRRNHESGPGMVVSMKSGDNPGDKGGNSQQGKVSTHNRGQ